MNDVMIKDELNSVFKEILDNILEGINLVNINGQLVYVNKMSAKYVNSTPEKMIGEHISKFYPQAAVLEVIKSGNTILNHKTVHSNGKIYIVNAFPLFRNKKLVGAYASFKDITELEELNKKISTLKMHVDINRKNDAFSEIIGIDSSLYETILKAKKAVGSLGGPRHCIISGESGTGKTMLAKSIYNYAKEIGVISKDAPFIEVNCAQFTNPDIAAMEIFGSENGAFTGSREKKGLFELANGGILFLDEAHTLDSYQNLLLKAIECGKIKRIGGVKEININVIVIAASTKDLKKVLLPELYQRLAQYELKLLPLRSRSISEKKELLDYFTMRYQENVKERYGIYLKVVFSKEAENTILNGYYPRNIRQFRDTVNESIDSAVPLINDVTGSKPITTVVTFDDLPASLINVNDYENKEVESSSTNDKKVISYDYGENHIDEIILQLRDQGLGPRKIAKALNRKGYDIKYYQIAYKLKKYSKSQYRLNNY